MKSTLALASSLVLAFGASSVSSAKDVKIGFIRSDVIFKEYRGTSEAQEKYNKEVAKWEQQAEEKQKKIKELQEQLEKQSLLMSEEKKNAVKEDIKRLYLEYQEYVSKVFGQQGEAFKKNEEYTKPILKKINAILDEIGKAEKYDFIFDATSGGVVFAHDAYDLTDRILKELNKGL